MWVCIKKKSHSFTLFLDTIVSKEEFLICLISETYDDEDLAAMQLLEKGEKMRRNKTLSFKQYMGRFFFYEPSVKTLNLT